METDRYERVVSPRDAQLLQEGWVRRFVAAPDRLHEARRLYTQLGYEVCVEPVQPEELSPQCHGCQLALTFFRVLYTRKYL